MQISLMLPGNGGPVYYLLAAGKPHLILNDQYLYININISDVHNTSANNPILSSLGMEQVEGGGGSRERKNILSEVIQLRVSEVWTV